MKYIVNFTLPMLCSAIVEAEDAEEAYKIINNKELREVKNKSLDFQVIDDRPGERDLCDIMNVEQYDEEI